MTPQLTPEELQEIAELLDVAGSLISQQAILCSKTMPPEEKVLHAGNARRAGILSRKVFDLIAAGRYPRFDVLGNLPKDTVIAWKGERCVVTVPFTVESGHNGATIERPQHGPQQLACDVIVYVYGMKG